MSVEAMWAVYFGDVLVGQVNSGVAIFETGRIFGGDSLMAYLGHYTVNDSLVTGELKVWAFNPTLTVTTAFGKMGTPEGSMVALEGTLNPEATEIHGALWEMDNPGVKIPAHLNKVAELP